ncbi:MAG TPA: MATE family efflux transporter, partial [Ruminococcaceae bacterium]|nr:MATE family efflux transporter [Oscillospiraceae bacterium]
MAKTERIQNMTKGSPAKLIFTFAIPLMLGNVFQQFYTVVDTAIVGQALGVNALAALGAADWLNWLVLGLIQGFAQGFSIYMAQRFGAEDHEGLNRAIGATISLSAVISILTVILSQVAMAPVLRAMNTPEEIIGGAFTYLRIMFAGIPIIMAYNVLASILRALGDSKTPLWFLIASSVGNIVLDAVFVIVFHWGVGGVAWATFLAQGVASACAFWAVLRRLKSVETKEKPALFSGAMLRRISIVAIPSILQQS